MLTQERLKELLYYCPETGVFVRKINSYQNTAIIGDIAGGKDPRGYISIRINSRYYRCHRLAWLYMHGYFPEHGLDHINMDTSDNRIDNLREASKACNARNTGNWDTNTSGVKGVVWDKRSEKWNATIMNYYKKCSGGAYKNFYNAACARLALEQSLNWANCESSSPAYQYVKEHIQKF